MRSVISAVILLVALSSFGATYYVDFSSGSDSNAGTSSGAPFKHAPGDPRRGGSVPATLTNGDTLLFRSGVVYTMTNVAFPIISGTTVAIYGGTNWAIISGDRTIAPHALDAFSGAGGIRSGVTFSNLAFIDIGGYPPGDPIWSTDTQDCTTNLLTAPFGGAGIRFGDGFKDVRIENCRFERVGTWTNSSPLSGTQSVSGSGVVLEGGTNAVVKNCFVTQTRVGIRLQASSSRPMEDVTIEDCEIGDWIVWNIDASVTTETTWFKRLRIVGCTIKNKYQHDQTMWDASGGCGDAPHTDGIFLRNSGTKAYWYDTVIDKCRFFSDAASSSGGTAMIYASEGGGGDMLISNCLFMNIHDSAAIQIAPGSRQIGGRTVHFLHNTIFGGGSRPIRVTGTNHVLVLHGNIFMRSVDSATATLINHEAFNPIDSDRNVYFNPPRATGTYYPFYRSGWPVSGTWTTWATWQSLGYDPRSVFGDPLFLDYTNATASARNLNIGAASVARNLAADYASIYPQFATWLTNDFAGNPRVEPFDAGALQYTDEVPPPDPPPPSGSTNGTGQASAVLMRVGTIQ